MLDPFTTLTSMMAEEIYRRTQALKPIPTSTRGPFDMFSPPSPPPAIPRPSVDLASWRQAEAALTRSLLAGLTLPRRVPGHFFFWENFLKDLEVGSRDVVEASLQVARGPSSAWFKTASL